MCTCCCGPRNSKDVPSFALISQNTRNLHSFRGPVCVCVSLIFSRIPQFNGLLFQNFEVCKLSFVWSLFPQAIWCDFALFEMRSRLCLYAQVLRLAPFANVAQLLSSCKCFKLSTADNCKYLRLNVRLQRSNFILFFSHVGLIQQLQVFDETQP